MILKSNLDSVPLLGWTLVTNKAIATLMNVRSGERRRKAQLLGSRKVFLKQWFLDKVLRQALEEVKHSGGMVGGELF